VASDQPGMDSHHPLNWPPPQRPYLRVPIRDSHYNVLRLIWGLTLGLWPSAGLEGGQSVTHLRDDNSATGAAGSVIAVVIQLWPLPRWRPFPGELRSAVTAPRFLVCPPWAPRLFQARRAAYWASCTREVSRVSYRRGWGASPRCAGRWTGGWRCPFWPVLRFRAGPRRVPLTSMMLSRCWGVCVLRGRAARRRSPRWPTLPLPRPMPTQTRCRSAHSGPPQPRCCRHRRNLEPDHAAGLRNCAAAVRPQTWCADGPAGLRRPGAGRGVVGLPVMMSRSFTAVGAWAHRGSSARPPPRWTPQR